MASDSDSKSFRINPQLQLLLSAAIAVGVLLVGVLLVLFVVQPSPPFPPGGEIPRPSVPPTFTPAAEATPKATYTPTPLPTPIHVSWRELGYLTTVEYVGKTVVEEKDKSFWGTDWLLLEVPGKVFMGVDLEQLSDQDIVIEGTSVQIVLPRPTVQTVSLLHDQIVIYMDKKKIYASEQTKLHDQALAKAQAQLADWYGEQEVWVTLAEDLTRRRLYESLEHLGFEKIEIVFRKSSGL